MSSDSEQHFLPRVFLSYAWEDGRYGKYRTWIERLAFALRRDGMNVRLDRWDYDPTQETAAFMNSEVREADRVLVVGSPMYRTKVHAHESGKSATGSGWEAMLISNQRFLGNKRKVIVAIGLGPKSEALPDFLMGLDAFDLVGEEPQNAYDDLVSALRGHATPLEPLFDEPGWIETRREDASTQSAEPEQNDCSASPVAGALTLIANEESITIGELGARLQVSKSDERVACFEGGLIHLLKLLGMVRFDGTMIRPIDKARSFLGSLAVHAREDRRFLRAWTEPADPRVTRRLQQILDSIDSARLDQAPTIPTRTVDSVVALIRAKEGGQDRFLMSFNPRWLGGIWWFVGGIARERFASDGTAYGDDDLIRNQLVETMGRKLGLTASDFSFESAGVTNGDVSVSERTGALTNYFFHVFSVNLRNCPSHFRGNRFSNSQGLGGEILKRKFAWLTLDEMLEDVPAGSSPARIIKEVVGSAPKPLYTEVALESTSGCVELDAKYGYVVFDAGGLVFDEPFWLGLERERYERFDRAVPSALTEEHFVAISRMFSEVGRPLKIRRDKLFKDLYAAYDAKYTHSGNPYAKGNVCGDVLETFRRIKESRRRIFLFSAAPMLGKEFRERYGGHFGTDGKSMVDDFVTTRDLEASKTTPVAWRRLTEHIGANKEDVLFVTHDLTDIVGASIAGGLHVAACKVNHTEVRLARKFAHYFLRTLRDVGDLLNCPDSSSG